MPLNEATKTISKRGIAGQLLFTMKFLSTVAINMTVLLIHLGFFVTFFKVFGHSY